ncbi:hypothetical protein C2E23DRAFT_329843 [Lenzites betulinus]|nr:hypothetical protein C2E23DRAFT_329843 [Lenzites betulinus]
MIDPGREMSSAAQSKPTSARPRESAAPCHNARVRPSAARPHVRAHIPHDARTLQSCPCPRSDTIRTQTMIIAAPRRPRARRGVSMLFPSTDHGAETLALAGGRRGPSPRCPVCARASILRRCGSGMAGRVAGGHWH